MNTTDPVDLEALRDMRFAADNGGATEGQCYSWWKGITAELTARRARDKDVEALVDRLASDRSYSSGEAVDDLRSLLSFTGANPCPHKTS